MRGEGKPFTKSMTPNRGRDHPKSLSTQSEASKSEKPTESQLLQKSDHEHLSVQAQNG